MSKNLDAKCKQCRRVGEKLLLKGDRCNTPKCAMVKRNYPPGIHGVKGRNRTTGYGLQLMEKQKARKTYNLLEKQFRLTFEKAKKMPGNVGENFLQLLEMRLDNVIYKMNIAPSRSKARQVINHGHITVNDKKVSIPSFTVKKGDVIKIKAGSMRTKLFSDLKEKVKTLEAPGWIYFEKGELTGKILHAPNSQDIATTINISTVVEFYSR